MCLFILFLFIKSSNCCTNLSINDGIFCKFIPFIARTTPAIEFVTFPMVRHCRLYTTGNRIDASTRSQMVDRLPSLDESLFLHGSVRHPFIAFSNGFVRFGLFLFLAFFGISFQILHSKFQIEQMLFHCRHFARLLCCLSQNGQY